ncbi:MAG TPA: phasin family protein [Xanthobacteraceae bacterium]|nr:phasin family protein [Xanthobacteraceae bacterium]
MANQPFDFAVPPEMRAIAEKSVEQARKAFDGFVTAAEQATAGFEQRAKAARAGATDVAQKAMSFAEQNVANSFDLAQKLVAAKGVNEVVQLHADYVRKQMQVLARQAEELSQSATKMGSDRGGGTKSR